MFETISIIGLGYIGLPTAALFASRKCKVIGVDISKHIIDTINGGIVHISEPALEALVCNAVKQDDLRATLTPEPADAFLIAVPTPFKDGHQPDLSHVESAIQAIAPVLQRGNLVILESTSPVGTTEKVAAWMAMARPDLTFPQQAGENADIQIAYCPERVLPGNAIQELVNNDRVIGGMTHRAGQMSAALYKTFVQGQCIVTNARTAEMCKLAENSFRDVNIAFANELSVICDKLGIDVWELIKLANNHPRVNILQPGPGVGGHCIAIDPWFIASQTPGLARLIRAARQVNDDQPQWVAGKVKLAIADYLQAHPDTRARDVTVACLGLAYKPDVSDLRQSPALRVVETLANECAGHLCVVEPNLRALPSSLASPRVTLTDLNTALATANVVTLLVDHVQFRNITPHFMDSQQLIDTRGIWRTA